MFQVAPLKDPVNCIAAGGRGAEFGAGGGVESSGGSVERGKDRGAKRVLCVMVLVVGSSASPGE